MLATMYQEQSELRLAVLPSILSPLLLFLIAVCVCTAIISALVPLLSLLQWLAGP
jgi:type II secretory pathway component PulF